MKQADALLQRVELFEKLALYGDRKNFLEAIAQEVSPQDINNTKEHKRCNCEQAACEKSEKHVAGSCKNHAGDKKALYIGAICDECAKTMPQDYMK